MPDTETSENLPTIEEMSGLIADWDTVTARRTTMPEPRASLPIPSSYYCVRGQHQRCSGNSSAKMGRKHQPCSCECHK